MSNGEENQGAQDVRSKALQDLRVVSARRREAEQRAMELRAEEADLEAFIRRLDRYDPPSDGQSPLEVDVVLQMKSRPHGAVKEGIRHWAFPQKHRVMASAIRQFELPVTAANSATSPDTQAIQAAVAETLAHDVDKAIPDVPVIRKRSKEIPSPTSRRGLIANYVLSILELVGPMPTKWIVDMVRSQSTLFEYLGTRPEATLSSYLSRDPRFLFDQEGRVWTLASNRQNESADQDGADVTGEREEGSVSS